MKKINASYELYKLKSKSKIKNKKPFKVLFISSFVILFGIIALFGIGYSGLFNEEYYIKIDIINGYEDKYYEIVNNGYFEDYLVSPNADVKSFVCTSGDLKYDGYKIYTNNVYENIECTLEFVFNVPDGIDVSKLDKVNDNFGISYMFNKNLDNYFYFNDMLFRIIRVNGDGTLRLILNDSIGKYTYFERDNVLNEWISNFVNNEYLVYSSYDYNNLDNFGDSLVNIYEYNISNVGLISVNELLMYGINYDNTMLSNKYYDKYWALLDYNIQTIDSNAVLDIRPVINISASLISGDGTEELPYKIVK